MPNIRMQMSAQDIAKKAVEHVKGMHSTNDAVFDLKEKRAWVNEFLTNPSAMEFAHNEYDAQIIGEALSTRSWEIREMYEEDRQPLWFLDMFRDKGLLTEIQPGQRGDFIGVTRHVGGEINYIGDKTDDWPTSGGSYNDYSANHYKYFAGSVEIGLIEQWQAVREGRDLLSERLRMKLRDMDEFNDSTIATGAPNHGIYGFVEHPDIPQTIVPAGASGSTQWTGKTAGEIRFDIQEAMESVRTGSSYNAVADILMMADLRYKLIGSMSVSPEGTTFLNQLAKDFDALPWANASAIQSFKPFDSAGPGDTPVMLAGVLNQETAEFPIMPAIQLEPEYHGSQWKIGLVGAHGSLRVKRENRLQAFTGI